MSKKEKQAKRERSHGIVYYAVFFGLLAVLILLTVLAIALDNVPLIFGAIGVAVVYLGFFLFMYIRTRRRVRTAEKLAQQVGQALLASDEPENIYIVYFGELKHAKKPSVVKKDFYVEFYRDTDISALKRHLYYGLSAQQEKELKQDFLGSVVCTVADVLNISGKRVFLQDDFYQEAIASLTYAHFLDHNDVVVFGKTEEKNKKRK